MLAFICPRDVPHRGRRRALACALAAGLVAALGGCASTQVQVGPGNPAPACDASRSAVVLWGPEWRIDQKDRPLREAAALQGLTDFFGTSGCFARHELRRLDGEPASWGPQADAVVGSSDRVLVIRVRELGPVLRFLSSPALVDGATEVRLDVSEHSAATGWRHFNVHWTHGGPGVVKGVSSLPADMRAALAAGLQARREPAAGQSR